MSWQASIGLVLYPCRLLLGQKMCLKLCIGSIVFNRNANSISTHLPRIVAESPTGGNLYLFPDQVSGSFPMFVGDSGKLDCLCRVNPFYEYSFSIYVYPLYLSPNM